MQIEVAGDHAVVAWAVRERGAVPGDTVPVPHVGVVDVANVRAPGSVHPLGLVLDPIHVDPTGRWLFGGSGGDLHAYDIRQPTRPRLLSVVPNLPLYDLQARDGILVGSSELFGIVTLTYDDAGLSFPRDGTTRLPTSEPTPTRSEPTQPARSPTPTSPPVPTRDDQQTANGAVWLPIARR
jgi:hypothetical protein